MDQRTYNPTLVFVMLVAFLILLLAIAGPAGAAPNFTAADNEQHVIVNAGDRVDVTLRTDPQSGFTWMAIPDESAVLQHTGRAFERTALGGQGFQTLSFMVARPAARFCA
jgi:predicted secreted protein